MTIKELIAGRKSPEVPTYFGKGQVVSEKELRKPSFGIGFDLPAEPDYEALRDRQITQSGRYEAFHSSGTGIFAEETAALLDLHLAQIEEAYRRYLEAVTTTYAAELHVMKQDAIGEMSLIDKGAEK
ncbi:hypothetical protein [uncultured Senegalimassilia sp.]|uniref:hypothetical protein n=1 Tax=uncultured Senegalimassilia sp. TaxID=1714350 RepID=UPI0025F84408|nr:hypothetical protein [uncultured Senegalimassilia sp.]